MRAKSCNQNRLMRIITIPIRFLKKGRDLYVRSMMDYAQKPRYGSNMMAGSRREQISGLPKSFSSTVSSSRASNYESEDLGELIRANSTSITNNNNGNIRVDTDLYLKQLIREQQMRQLQQSMENIKSKSKGGVVPRSASVGMGRIDEEKPSDFDEEEDEYSQLEESSSSTNFNGVKKTEPLKYPRSRSHAVGQRSTLAF